MSNLLSSILSAEDIIKDIRMYLWDPNSIQMAVRPWDDYGDEHNNGKEGDYQEELLNDMVRYHGTTPCGFFAHYCSDYDGLPIDEFTYEFVFCNCFNKLKVYEHMIAEIKRSYGKKDT